MAEAGRVSQHGRDHTVHGLSLFACCRCHSSTHERFLLSCLHNYCRFCFDSSASRTHILKATLTCPACTEVTDTSTVLRNDFLSTYERASALDAEIVWCNTCEKTAKWEMAEVWCVVCAGALCAACYLRHRKFSNSHHIFELEHARTLPLRLLTETLPCNFHKRPVETLCFTCRWPKCVKCLASCAGASHDWNFLSDERSREQIFSVTTRVRRTAERLDSILSDILQKCGTITSRLSANRISGQRMLAKRRRQLYDSTMWAFDESANEMCSGLQSIWFKCHDFLKRSELRNCSVNIDALSQIGVRSLRILAVRNLLKMEAACCCSSLRSLTRRLLQRCEEIGSISICGSLSLTSDIVLSACLGATDRMREEFVVTRTWRNGRKQHTIFLNEKTV